MYIQIIPDIHNKILEAQQIIDKEKADKIVFLGDYFDSIGDTLERTHQTALWLKDSMNNPDRIHLIGNHDLAYINQHYMCAGFSQGKLFAIKNTKIDLGKLINYCWVGDWLCTHAGLTNEFFKAYNTKELFVDDFLDDMIENYKFRLYGCSIFRGGRDPHAGIVWCDYDEFIPIGDLKQIFGHTHGVVRRQRDNWCIDTWLKYYGLYDTETNKMMIKLA